jgi:hypothetical protein
MHSQMNLRTQRRACRASYFFPRPPAIRARLPLPESWPIGIDTRPFPCLSRKSHKKINRNISRIEFRVCHRKLIHIKIFNRNKSGYFSAVVPSAPTRPGRLAVARIPPQKTKAPRLAPRGFELTELSSTLTGEASSPRRPVVWIRRLTNEICLRHSTCLIRFRSACSSLPNARHWSWCEPLKYGSHSRNELQWSCDRPSQYGLRSRYGWQCLNVRLSRYGLPWSCGPCCLWLRHGPPLRPYPKIRLASRWPQLQGDHDSLKHAAKCSCWQNAHVRSARVWLPRALRGSHVLLRRTHAH